MSMLSNVAVPGMNKLELPRATNITLHLAYYFFFSVSSVYFYKSGVKIQICLEQPTLHSKRTEIVTAVLGTYSQLIALFC